MREREASRERLLRRVRVSGKEGGEKRRKREREKKAATKASPERSVARVDLCGFQAVWHSGLQVENN